MKWSVSSPKSVMNGFIAFSIFMPTTMLHLLMLMGSHSEVDKHGEVKAGRGATFAPLAFALQPFLCRVRLKTCCSSPLCRICLSLLNLTPL